MSKIICNINELAIDTIVEDATCGGYAKVRQCVHGNKYYAMLSWAEDINKPVLDTLPIAYDTDIDYIPCCG